MSDTSSQQPCPRCSTPGAQQNYMRRLYINLSECVDMCPNTKCQWVQLVSADLGANCQTPLLGGLSSTVLGPGVDPFDQLLDSLPSVDSGVDVDGSDRSAVSCWESAPSDAGSLCSELAGVGLSSVNSEAGGGPSSAASEPCAGVWRSQSAPAGHRSSTAGDSLVTDTRSEPARRMDRRGRPADPRPLPGLALRAFNNSEKRLSLSDLATMQTPSPKSRRPRKGHISKGLYVLPSATGGKGTVRPPPPPPPLLPPWERAALRHALAGNSWELMYGVGRDARRRCQRSAIRKLQRVERLEKAAAATAAVAQVAGKPARAATSTPAATSSASSGSAEAAPSSSPAPSRAPAAKVGPVPRPGHRSTPRHAVSAAEVAAKLDGMLTSPDLLQRLCSTHNTDLVYVRAKQVERVKTWAKKKADAAGAAGAGGSM